jgi:hypothetical protein
MLIVPRFWQMVSITYDKSYIWKFVSNKACSSPIDFNAIFPINYMVTKIPYCSSKCPSRQPTLGLLQNHHFRQPFSWPVSQEAIGLGLSVSFFFFFFFFFAHFQYFNYFLFGTILTEPEEFIGIPLPILLYFASF